MPGDFAVIGLGAFGRSVALNLARFGQSVLAVDVDQKQVDAFAAQVSTTVCADATDEASLRELALERMSGAVVAIGADAVEASILATTLLRQLGVPQIVARAINKLHARVLVSVGAHIVLSPEEEMGERVARRLAQPNVLERLELSDDADLAEVAVPESFVGKTLVELDLRRQYAVTVVAIRRGRGVLAAVEESGPLASGDVLMIVGAPAAIGRLAARV